MRCCNCRFIEQSMNWFASMNTFDSYVQIIDQSTERISILVECVMQMRTGIDAMNEAELESIVSLANAYEC